MEGLLERMLKKGGRDALAAFGLPSQPSLGSIGVQSPVKAPGLPGPAKPPSVPKTPGVASGGSGGMPDVPKVAFNVGMSASTSNDGVGAARGEPAEEGRRQRSVIDRALQRNEDDYASSSMPLPGAVVSP